MTKKPINLAASQRISLNNLKTYADLNALSKSSIKIWGDDVKTDSQKKQAYTEYSEELLLQYYDLNHDGSVTVDEFAKVEGDGSLTALNLQGQKIDDDARLAAEKEPSLLTFYDKDKDGHISKDEYEKGLAEMDLSTYNNPVLNKTVATRSANLFAQNLDFNGNGKIDAKELAFFNENADAIDGAQDGVIKNAGESGMFGAVTGSNASNPEFNRVVNKYLQGETLTAEEQQILEQCQATIRKNMGKAAGINIEG